jgi:hypothetical protein
MEPRFAAQEGPPEAASLFGDKQNRTPEAKMLTIEASVFSNFQVQLSP